MEGIAKLIAGDTLDFTTSSASYLASDGWTLKYRLAPRFATPAQAPITLTATAYEVSAYRVQVAASATATWAAGVYSWASWVEKSGQRVTLEQGGELIVAPDPATVAQGADLRSSAEKALEAVTALLTGKATSGTESYVINGREMRSYSLPDLIKLQAKLKAEVNGERVAAGLAPPRSGIQRIFVRAA